MVVEFNLLARQAFDACGPIPANQGEAFSIEDPDSRRGELEDSECIICGDSDLALFKLLVTTHCTIDDTSEGHESRLFGSDFLNGWQGTGGDGFEARLRRCIIDGKFDQGCFAERDEGLIFNVVRERDV